MSMLFTFELDFSFSGQGDDVSYTKSCLVSEASYTPTSSHVIIFERKSGSLESPSMCCHDCLSAPLSANGAQIGSYLTNVQTDSKNALN